MGLKIYICIFIKKYECHGLWLFFKKIILYLLKYKLIKKQLEKSLNKHNYWFQNCNP